MSIAIVGVLVVVAVLTAGVFLALPAMSRSTLPLGVQVPIDRLEDPAVVGALRGYRVGIVANLVGSLVIAWLVAAFEPVVASIALFGVLTVGSVAAYLLARRRILAAKQSGAWMQGIPVRLTASVTPGSATRARPAYGWYVAGALLLLALVVFGALSYDRLPDSIVTNWGIDGVPALFTDKSVWSVFGLAFTGFGTLVLIFAVSVGFRFLPLRASAGERPEAAARFGAVQARLLQGLLGQTGFLVAVIMAGVAVLGWADHSTTAANPFLLIALLPPVVLLFGAVLIFVLRLSRARSEAFASDGTERERVVDARDDDRYWKGGMIYVNRGDPSLFVPRRVGVGLAMNLGHPAAIAISVVAFMAIAAAIALPSRFL